MKPATAACGVLLPDTLECGGATRSRASDPAGTVPVRVFKTRAGPQRRLLLNYFLWRDPPGRSHHFCQLFWPCCCWRWQPLIAIWLYHQRLDYPDSCSVSLRLQGDWRLCALPGRRTRADAQATACCPAQCSSSPAATASSRGLMSLPRACYGAEFWWAFTAATGGLPSRRCASQADIRRMSPGRKTDHATSPCWERGDLLNCASPGTDN